MNFRVKEMLEQEFTNDNMLYYTDEYYHDEYHDIYSDIYNDIYNDSGRYDDSYGGRDY